jgi:outer membrane protein TolC
MVLSGFQEVEDNLAALRILAQEAEVQDEAVKAARESVTITTNQYRAGTANYLAVVVVQTAALNNERTAVTILGQRLVASVALIKALGGGWSVTQGADAAPKNGLRLGARSVAGELHNHGSPVRVEPFI